VGNLHLNLTVLVAADPETPLHPEFLSLTTTTTETELTNLDAMMVRRIPVRRWIPTFYWCDGAGARPDLVVESGKAELSVEMLPTSDPITWTIH